MIFMAKKLIALVFSFLLVHGCAPAFATESADADSEIWSGQTASASLYDGTNKYQTVYLFADIKTSGEFKNGLDLRTTIRNSATNSDQGKSITVARIKGNNVHTNTGGTFAGIRRMVIFTFVIFTARRNLHGKNNNS